MKTIESKKAGVIGAGLIIAVIIIAILVIIYHKNILKNFQDFEKTEECLTKTAEDYCASLGLKLEGGVGISVTSGEHIFTCIPVIEEHQLYNYKLNKQFKLTDEEIERCKEII